MMAAAQAAAEAAMREAAAAERSSSGEGASTDATTGLAQGSQQQQFSPSGLPIPPSGMSADGSSSLDEATALMLGAGGPVADGGGSPMSTSSASANQQHMMMMDAAMQEAAQVAASANNAAQQQQSLPETTGLLLQELLGASSEAVLNHSDAQLLQLLAQQQAQPPQQLQQLLQQPMAEISAPMRIEKHYLTIAQNGGTILEATKTVTGFPPDALLMSCAYDAVYDDDLPGLLFIKTQFWDKAQLDVGVYIRRRSLDGDWIWLFSKAVSYDAQIPAIVLEESIAHDEELAQRVHRITRITAILVQAVEAALLTRAEQPDAAAANEQNLDDAGSQAEEKEQEASAPNVASADNMSMPENGDALQILLKTVLSKVTSSSTTGNSNMESTAKILEKELIENVAAGQKKTFDPFSVMESVRKGVRLDLGLTALSLNEIKMVTLVLSGKLHVEEFCPLILHVLQTGEGLEAALKGFSVDSDEKLEKIYRHSSSHESEASPQHPLPAPSHESPPIAVVNLSYTYMGNAGIETLSEILCRDDSVLRTLDVSFCRIEDKGMLALSRALARRKRKRIPPLQGIIISGNYLSARAASELGTALSPGEAKQTRKRSRSSVRRAGYDSDSGESSDDEDDEEEVFGVPSSTKKKPARRKSTSTEPSAKTKGGGASRERSLRVLHVASSSLTPEATSRLLQGLSAASKIRELNLSSNALGTAGATELVKFLESGQRSRKQVVMPFLDRLDISNNNLGDEGTTQLTRIILKRTEAHFVDLKLSSNNIGSAGVETIMNKLLQHNLVSLSLDKNAIGDQGCQLVAASLPTMTALSHLNLSFNQIGSRGINSLMRNLIACDSITCLGLSGNILKISGAMALTFTLAQHPRLEELDLDNCCLGQAAQCHISAGIISNRWVPMKRLKGFAAGPPMVAIGALKPFAQNLSNEECFRIRKDEQMKTILQWMESNRIAKKGGEVDPVIAAAAAADPQNPSFLTPDFVSTMNDVQGTPSQNAYFRLLGWLSQIPFDDDELTALQKYFYDADGGEGDRGSDGQINLKLRGDLLAALDSEVADEFRDEMPILYSVPKGSVGLSLDKLFQKWNPWKAMEGEEADDPPTESKSNDSDGDAMAESSHDEPRKEPEEPDKAGPDKAPPQDAKPAAALENGVNNSGQALPHVDSETSASGRERKGGKVKARVTMFPMFEQQLEELKATATEMIEQEEDPMQQEVILTQYAEASLTILRQLRYHCMNSGLDGWRQAGLKRKILVIDDSKVTRKLVARAFEKADFIVDTAADGAEGVEKMKDSIYDIAFMDIDMPVMNGFEATKRLREWEDTMRPGARQPICALTAAYVDDFERSELMKFKDAGLDVMESKPCNMPRLFKVVDDVSPMFSDLSVSVIQRERSESKLSDTNSLSSRQSS